MDSEGSRTGSSSSSSSSENGRRSSLSPPPIGVVETKSPNLNNEASPRSFTERSSRSQTHSPNERNCAIRSPSKSNSDSSSESSSDENEVDNEESYSQMNNGNGLTKSPLRSRSRNSSLSSARSHSNSPHDELRVDGINISHEELSDVSDMENERRDSFFKKDSDYDDGQNSGSMQTEIETNTDDVKDDKFVNKYDNNREKGITDLRQKLEQKKKDAKVGDNEQGNIIEDKTDILKVNTGESIEDLVKTQDDEDLDFEAEEGECQEVSKDDERKNVQSDNEEKANANTKSDGEAEEGEELEEGEVSDEDEKRPEETEPKPICRFYTRGQCTWGMSCRFLHPGVTDKGNYTMFDLVRPVSLPQSVASIPRTANYTNTAPDYSDYRSERPPVHHRVGLIHPAPTYPPHHDPRSLVSDGPVVVESAWERGLRTAKEMMRKANKRKEQDMDFEDKKMNLTLSPDELEKEPYFIKERSSPPEVVAIPYGRHVYQDLPPSGLYSPSDRYGRSNPIPQYDEVDPYGRTTRYRELPAHRMPHYEDERRVRPTREVIVQRVEPAGRGDEWNDPWMRSKSPGARGTSRERNDKRHRDRRSYSSNSSYSSSSSSQSGSSSDSSRSPSPVDHKRRYNSTSSKVSPPAARRHVLRSGRSPSPPIRRVRHSPTALVDSKIDLRQMISPFGGGRHSPGFKRRAHVSPPPIQGKKSVYSPVHKRKKPSPVSKKTLHDKTKLNRRRSTSSSGSSDSSGSDSDSDSGSSSSESTSPSRGRSPAKRSRLPEKLMNKGKNVKKVETSKKRSPISIELKKPATVGTSALASSPTHSISSEKDSKKSRREELLKQLRAVEDAIAKKRSKLS